MDNDQLLSSMKPRKGSLIIQALVWGGIIVVVPTAFSLYTGEGPGVLGSIMHSLRACLPFLVLFYLNYFLLVPGFLFSKKASRKAVFYIANIIMIAAYEAYLAFQIYRTMQQGAAEHMPEGTTIPPFVVFFPTLIWLIIMLFDLGASVGLRYVERYYDMRHRFAVQQKENAEAELTWLKSQLNPHFLFNTLNNISSLTQIDPDRAQESIGQLSDLLRYALYDAQADRVPLSGEVEFMSNYVDLMALRCNEMTQVKKNFSVQGGVFIAPLLFISLIENAFKHGVNARHPSFVDMELRTEDDGILVFRVSNSLFEKTGSDHIGSGIGLENMKRRLDLIYPGHYSYEVDTGDGIYSSQVRIWGREYLGPLDKSLEGSGPSAV